MEGPYKNNLQKFRQPLMSQVELAERLKKEDLKLLPVIFAKSRRAINTFSMVRL